MVGGRQLGEHRVEERERGVRWGQKDGQRPDHTGT